MESIRVCSHKVIFYRTRKFVTCDLSGQFYTYVTLVPTWPWELLSYLLLLWDRTKLDIVAKRCFKPTSKKVDTNIHETTKTKKKTVNIYRYVNDGARKIYGIPVYKVEFGFDDYEIKKKKLYYHFPFTGFRADCYATNG